MSSEPSKQITTQPRNEIVIDSMRPEQITRQMQLLKQVMADNMEEGVHYGLIPGCGPKPALLKAGAETLRLLFFLAPTFDWRENDLGHGHKEWEFSCILTQIHTQQVWGAGVGSCSTMESKYRYRTDKQTNKKYENPDIANEYNTVRKMAKKRAFVDAILTATSASAYFTQDIEDMRDNASEKTTGDSKAVRAATGAITTGTTLIVPPDDEQKQVWRSTVKKVVTKSGQGQKGPWFLTGLFLPGDGGEDYYVSTFDRKLGQRAAAFEKKTCDITVMPGKKEGSWDLLDIAFPKISDQAKEEPPQTDEPNGENNEADYDPTGEEPY